MLVYDQNVPRNFRRIAIVAEILLSGDSEIRGAIEGIAQTNTILKHLLNKLEIHMTLTKHKAREQKLLREATVIGDPKRKYECHLLEHWEGEESEHCKC